MWVPLPERVADWLARWGDILPPLLADFILSLIAGLLIGRPRLQVRVVGLATPSAEPVSAA